MLQSAAIGSCSSFFYQGFSGFWRARRLIVDAWLRSSSGCDARAVAADPLDLGCVKTRRARATNEHSSKSHSGAQRFACAFSLACLEKNYSRRISVFRVFTQPGSVTVGYGKFREQCGGTRSTGGLSPARRSGIRRLRCRALRDDECLATHVLQNVRARAPA